MPYDPRPLTLSIPPTRLRPARVFSLSLSFSSLLLRSSPTTASCFLFFIPTAPFLSFPLSLSRLLSLLFPLSNVSRRGSRTMPSYTCMRGMCVNGVKANAHVENAFGQKYINAPSSLSASFFMTLRLTLLTAFRSLKARHVLFPSFGKIVKYDPLKSIEKSMTSSVSGVLYVNKIIEIHMSISCAWPRLLCDLALTYFNTK